MMQTYRKAHPHAANAFPPTLGVVRFCEMNANPQKSLPKLDPKLQKKLREARFFLSHMVHSARSTRLDHEHFEFHLSAFLSSARSVTSFLEDNHRAWWHQWNTARPVPALQLLNQIT